VGGGGCEVEKAKEKKKEKWKGRRGGSEANKNERK
jgi:hypothetical protein